MDRKITIRGKGRASAAPDYIEISLKITSADPSYCVAVEKGERMLGQLTSAALAAGFVREDVKTSSFRVSTQYDNQPDSRGMYKRVFKGYACEQGLRICFDYDLGLLNSLLTHLSTCDCSPELSVSFTLKDSSCIKDELLRACFSDAESKAKILSKSANVTLGALTSIDYAVNVAEFASPTRLNSEFMRADTSALSIKLDVTPENIVVEDTVVFCWEIN